MKPDYFPELDKRKNPVYSIYFPGQILVESLNHESNKSITNTLKDSNRTDFCSIVFDVCLSLILIMCTAMKKLRSKSLKKMFCHITFEESRCDYQPLDP